MTYRFYNLADPEDEGDYVFEMVDDAMSCKRVNYSLAAIPEIDRIMIIGGNDTEDG